MHRSIYTVKFVLFPDNSKGQRPVVDQFIKTLRHPFILPHVNRRQMSLWILPGVREEQVSCLARVNWINIWNIGGTNDLPSLLVQSGANRKPIIVDNVDKDVSEFSSNNFVRIYSSSQPDAAVSENMMVFRDMQLKSLVSSATGLLVFVGPVQPNIDEIAFVREIAPHLVLLSTEGDASINQDRQLVNFIWDADLESLAAELVEGDHQSKSLTADLKDAQGVTIDEDLLEAVEKGWTFLTADKISATDITQENFDRFLNGEPEWAAYSAGIAYSRRFKDRTGEEFDSLDDQRTIILSEHIREKILDLEQGESDPSNPIRQVRIFSELGSGTTTALRDAAVSVAQMGYPVLISKPHVMDLIPKTVELFLIDLQDHWRDSRRGRGHGSGNLPFVIFIDKDINEEVAPQRLSRILSAAGRETVIVRSFERSRDEIDRSKGVLALNAEVTEAETVDLGEHLRSFAARYNLAPVPSTDEWRAYHAGLTYMLRYDASDSGHSEAIPYLFLIGIQPFISERISDLNSLEQYYFQKWDQIQDRSLKSLVEILAAAGHYNISIPYDVLRRVEQLDLIQLESSPSDQYRTLDLFIEWHDEGMSTRNWYLRVRHPIIGRLLSRTIDPFEGDTPYRPLLPLLEGLSTKEEDLWFVETLISRAGKSFKRRASSFSLETDTSLQRAARAFFTAIPDYVRDASRVIIHHEARYHMHIIHACLDAIKLPHTTMLSASQVHAILENEYTIARNFLERAVKISSKYESDKNIYNTFALLLFNYADIVVSQDRNAITDPFSDRFSEAIDLQERAVGEDPLDGLSRYQFAHRIFQSIPTSNLSDEDKLEPYARAEVRFQELLKLHQEQRVRNIDPIDAEIQLKELYNDYCVALEQFPSTSATVKRFEVKYPESGIFLKIREILGQKSLRDGFDNAEIAESLRQFRHDMSEISNLTVRGTLYLNRLYSEDSQGRLEFGRRLTLIYDLKQKSFEQYISYWHDEAALLCQLDNLVAGANRFRELRAFRQNAIEHWIWLNERVLLTDDGSGDLREMVLVVHEPNDGWANFQNTDIRIKYQPYQFPEMKRGQPFSGFIRFTLNGMQVVSRPFAEADRVAMRLQ